jgi:hypothetical protein
MVLAARVFPQADGCAIERVGRPFFGSGRFVAAVFATFFGAIPRPFLTPFFPLEVTRARVFVVARFMRTS